MPLYVIGAVVFNLYMPQLYTLWTVCRIPWTSESSHRKNLQTGKSSFCRVLTPENTSGWLKTWNTIQLLATYRFCDSFKTFLLTGSSSSSWSEKLERNGMLDSEWSERTDMAESERREVLIGGWKKKKKSKRNWDKSVAEAPDLCQKRADCES